MIRLSLSLYSKFRNSEISAVLLLVVPNVDPARGNMRIGKIASGAEYRTNEQFQNSIIFRILIVFRNKNSKNLLIFQFGKFQ